MTFRMMRQTAVRFSVCAGLVSGMAACGGGDGGTTAPPTVATVVVTLGATQLIPGATTGASAVVRSADGTTLTGRSIVWSSSALNIATVDAAGAVSAVAAGSATISATSEGRSGTALLTVVPPPVAAITVSLAQSSLSISALTSATATLRDANGAVLNDRAIAWSSSNSAVATVTGTGVVTALSAGTTSIVATSEGRSGAATLTVLLQPVATVTITGAGRVKVGDSYTYTATLRLADGSVVSRPIVWSVTDNSRGVFIPSGVFTPLRVGTFTIRVVVDGVAWTSDYVAYDWEAFTSGTTQFAVLEADITIANRSGTLDYSELVVSCGSTGSFFVWVRTPHVITASGAVALSFDGGAVFSQTWDELSPNFNTLWKPGTNAAIKAFAVDIARYRQFGFAFSEFQGAAKAMIFRVGGLSPLLTPLLNACPASASSSNNVTASADDTRDAFHAQRAALEAHMPTRWTAAMSAESGERARRDGPLAPLAVGLESVLRTSVFPVVHTQLARPAR